MEHKTLKQATPNWKSEGIFAALEAYDVPWKEDAEAATLDLGYYANHSGSKPIAPIVEELVDESGVLDSDGMEALAMYVWTINGANWTRTWKALTAEYNPINNYDMKEEQTESDGQTRTPDLKTEVVVNNEQITRDAGIYGFSSSEAVPTEESHDTVKGGRTTSETGVETNMRLSNHVLTRSGNIGVTTSQQMIDSELKLRRNRYFEIVYADIDACLVLPYYDLGRCLT